MFKKRYFSVDHDFKTSYLSMFFIITGIILLALYIFFKIISFVVSSSDNGVMNSLLQFSQTHHPDTIFSFSIICLAFGIIFNFFHRQFSKLADIAEEIENCENIEELNN